MAAWLISISIVFLYYGGLGVLAGRKYDYVLDSYHEAVSSAPERFYRLTRAQNWIGYRNRKQMIGVGSGKSSPLPFKRPLGLPDGNRDR